MTRDFTCVVKDAFASLVAGSAGEAVAPKLLAFPAICIEMPGVRKLTFIFVLCFYCLGLGQFSLATGALKIEITHSHETGHGHDHGDGYHHSNQHFQADELAGHEPNQADESDSGSSNPSPHTHEIFVSGGQATLTRNEVPLTVVIDPNSYSAPSDQFPPLAPNLGAIFRPPIS